MGKVLPFVTNYGIKLPCVALYGRLWPCMAVCGLLMIFVDCGRVCVPLSSCLDFSLNE